ncbi:MAG TPA: S8 family serine peptidase [Verrucomicrobiae bacterium]|nr:S8 family serine peptidase [Verrucomicrobiae bacterium]
MNNRIIFFSLVFLSILFFSIGFKPDRYEAFAHTPTIQLDQLIYSWTDRVYITVVSPDHNLDPNLIDTIGNNSNSTIDITVGGNKVHNYKLVESGVDTGIFTGFVILTGNHTLKGPGGLDGNGLNPTGTGPSGIGPADGLIPASRDDQIMVSLHTTNQTVNASAPIQWNVGEIKWLDSSYPLSSSGVLQIVDPDMNLNPKAVDRFSTNVWSSSYHHGININMTETGQDTGVFQGTVYFSTIPSFSNHLLVANGDIVTGEYSDTTLPFPHPTASQQTFAAAALIGSMSTSQKLSLSNESIVDTLGNPILGTISVGQQTQLTATMTNNQNQAQPFAYFLQIKNHDGVIVSLSWITGALNPLASLNPALGWTPSTPDTYTVQIFVMQSVDNPILLSQVLEKTVVVGTGSASNYSNTSVSLSGTVNPPFQNDKVVLMVFSPFGNLVQVVPTDITSNGNFLYPLVAGGPLFTQTGTYTAKVVYGASTQNNLTFTCDRISPINCSTNAKNSQDKHRIKFTTGDFLPPEGYNITTAISSIRAGHHPGDAIHFLIQFTDLPNLAKLQQIGSLGFNLTSPLTGSAYIGSSTYVNLNNLTELSGVSWAGPYVGDQKLATKLNPLHTINIPTWARIGKDQVAITLVLHKDVDPNVAASRIASIYGGNNVTIIPIIPDITAVFGLGTINGTISALAQNDDIQFIDFVDPPLQAVNDQARETAGVDQIQQQIPTLDGSGAKVILYDDGPVDSGHHGLPNVTVDPDIPTTTQTSPHATNVAGILGGNGIDSGNYAQATPTTPPNQYRGMAPGADIISFAIPTGTSIESQTTAIVGGRLDMYNDIIKGVSQFSGNLASMSLGANAAAPGGDITLLGKYTDTSLLIDTLVLATDQNPLIFFEAAGNSRQFDTSTTGDFNTIDAPASAKNSIVVGAINTDHREITDYTAFGPTMDGRIKPDIVAPGSHTSGCMDDSCGLVSTAPMESYSPMHGTSQATPVAAGVGALIIQEWQSTHDNFGGTPVLPLPSTVKAILIHTATDLGNPGPDYEFGWGAVNATAAIDLILADQQKNHELITEGVSTLKNNVTFPFQSDGSRNVKATLVWDDTESSPSQSKALVNDLDLRLISPSNTVFKPLVLDPCHPNNPAVQGNDDTNNVEMALGNTESGTWHVQVNFTSVAGLVQANNVTLNPQKYTLIISNETYGGGQAGSNGGVIGTAPNLPTPCNVGSVIITAIPSTGNPFTYTFSATEGGISLSNFQWSFGDGNTSNDPNPIHTYTSTGSFPVSVNVTDANLHHQSSSRIVIVSIPPVTITATPSEANPLTYTFSATEGGISLSNFQWSFGDGNTSNEPNPTHTYGSSGSRTVSVIVDSLGHNQSASKQITVSLPVAHLTINKQVSNGFTGTKSPSDFVLWVIDSLNHKTPMTNGVQRQLLPGTYTVGEDPEDGYTPSYSSNCPNGQITLVQGDHQICTITNSHCLIATAAFGSELAPPVQFLRDFRDYKILSTADGASFMTAFNAWYYSFSPSVADYERGQPWLQEIVRTSIYPLVGILTTSEKAYSVIPGEYGSLSAGFIASSLIGALYFWPFALLLPQIRSNSKTLNYKVLVIAFSVIYLGTLLTILIGNHPAMMISTSLFVLSLVSIFAILSAKAIVMLSNRTVLKKLKFQSRNQVL